MFGQGILGINARNIHYIKKFNPKKQIKLANNKIKTKKFLWERGIPVAKNYGIISSHKELLHYDFGTIPHNQFVIKPNKGSKGKGIYIVTREQQEEDENNTTTQKNKNILPLFNKIFPRRETTAFPYVYKTQGKVYTDNEFKRILLDTLDGKNSTSVLKDKILIEEKLNPSKEFSLYCQEGLADIRIIVFNLVPITAMIRIPTKKSDGKANLAKGGTALGIDITTGKVKYQERKIQPHFPETYTAFKNKNIEYWDEILLLSSKIQYFVNLGYLALDRVITPEGPKLLEINGRAGLDIQKVTGIKIKNALKKIAGLKITHPEKGIEISKALFSSKETQISKDKILYLSQMGTLKTTEIEIPDITVKLKLNSKNNYISQNLADIVKGKHEIILDESKTRIKNSKFIVDEDIKGNEIHLGTNVSKEYLIKPIHKIRKIKNIIKPEFLDIQEKEKLLQIDNYIHNISKKLILSSTLKPTNYLDELDTFITKKGKYNPTFTYKRPKQEVLEHQKNSLLENKNKLEKEIHSPIKKIFEEKIEELLYRINLIEAYSKQNYKDILFYNKKLFGNFSDELIAHAKSKSFESESDPHMLGKYLTISQIRKKIEENVNEKGFNNIDIIVSSTNLSRISIVKSQIPKVKILEGARIRTLELKSIMAHEINTHLTRYVNGQETERKIFQDGTGFYLRDEEGLAVYNAFQETDKINYHKNTIYKNYFLTNEAQKYNFAKMFDLVNFLFSGQNTENIFRKTMRLKKGIENTKIVNEGAIFFKEKIYLDGYEYIKKNIDKIDNPNILYKGKIKLSESKYII